MAAESAAASPPRAEVVATIGKVRVRRGKGEAAFYFVAGLAIDADGAPRAYHPAGSPPGLDYLANAGHPGDWWGLVTQGGKPVVQTATDPAPGFYVSTTALQDGRRAERDPRRYVDSSRVPYVVLPPKARAAGGAKLGDFAAVWNRQTNKLAFAILADIGPADKIGEGSMALARALGVTDSPKTGGQASDVTYVIFAGSGNGKPRTRAAIKKAGGERLEHWGGVERLRKAKP